MLLRSAGSQRGLRAPVSWGDVRHLHGGLCASEVSLIRKPLMENGEKRTEPERQERSWGQFFFHIALWLGVALVAGLCSVMR